MEKKNYKFNLLCIAYVILIISSGIRFISFEQQFIITMNLKGYYFTVGAMPLAIYSAYKKDKGAKILEIIGIIITLMGYSYTLYIVISNYNKLFTLDLGFYVYILSLLIFLCSLFLTNGEGKKDNIQLSKDNDLEDYSSLNNKKDDFIIGNIILGFKEIPFKSLVLLGINEDYNQLMLSYKLNNQEKNIYFKYDSILKIEYKQEPLIKYDDVKSFKYDNNEIDYFVVSFMSGSKSYSPFLQYRAFQKLEEIPYEYKKADIKTIYKVNIMVMFNGEKKEIVISTIKNPEIFINKIKEKCVNI